jgi:hypothetical protein
MDLGKKYVSEIMPSVPGWLYPPDAFCFRALDRIQKAKSIKGHLAEVGVFCGKCLGLMATFRAEDEGVYGFDFFTGAASIEKTRETIMRAVGNTDFVQLIATNSLTLPEAKVREIIPGPLRFLHIDAGHEYEEALSDMRKFVPLVRDGGVIAVDDYYDRDFPGVAAATNDFTRESGLVPFLAGYLKIFLCHKKNVKPYISALLEFPDIRAQAHLARHREEHTLIPFSPKHKEFEGPLLDFIREEKTSQKS